MKNIIAVLLVSIFLFACGNDMVVNGKKHTTYGFINKEQVKDPAVEYRVIVGNVIWGIIFVETIFAPVYFFGFSLYEPVGVKT